MPFEKVKWASGKATATELPMGCFAIAAKSGRARQRRAKRQAASGLSGPQPEENVNGRKDFIMPPQKRLCPGAAPYQHGNRRQLELTRLSMSAQSRALKHENYPNT